MKLSKKMVVFVCMLFICISALTPINAVKHHKGDTKIVFDPKDNHLNFIFDNEVNGASKPNIGLTVNSYETFKIKAALDAYTYLFPWSQNLDWQFMPLRHLDFKVKNDNATDEIIFQDKALTSLDDGFATTDEINLPPEITL